MILEHSSNDHALVPLLMNAVSIYLPTLLPLPKRAVVLLLSSVISDAHKYLYTARQMDMDVSTVYNDVIKIYNGLVSETEQIFV